MNKLIACVVLFCMGIFFSLPCLAQEKPEMADVLRSNGKIYVVVAVCLTILIGLFLYTWRIDRKISRIEKEDNVQA